MKYPDLRATLMPTFIMEAEEHLGTLDRGLVELEGEGEGREALVQELFRAVHSLKGAARMVEVGGVERIAHAMEDLLGRIRDGRLVPDSHTVDLLLAATDALRTIVAAQQGGEGLDPSREEALSAALAAASEGRPFQVPGATPGHSPPGATAPPPQTGGRGTPGGTGPPKAAQSPVAAPAEKAGSRQIHVAISAVDRLVEMLAELGISAQGLNTPIEMIITGEQRLRRMAGGLERLRTLTGEDPAAVGERLAGIGKELREWALELVRAGQVVRRRTEEHLRLVREAREAAEALRMDPLASLFDRMPRVVRDTARSCGKQVTIEEEGGETVLDREILEQLSDPLLHLVRNAIDHGIEQPEERRAAGKPEAGRLTISARQRGSVVEIEVKDDGRGIDLDRLTAKAMERGLIDRDAVAARSPEELVQLVFASGLSTAKTVTELSGRGVGLDVVRTNIERLQGRVAVKSSPGRGTVFTLTVPLTLATTFTVVVSSGGTLLGFPGATVDRLLRVMPEELGSVEGRPTLEFDGRPLPIVDLGAMLGLGTGQRGGEPLLIVAGGVAEHRLGFVIDDIEGTYELVVSELGPQVQGLGMVAGGALLPDGRPVVLLDAGALVKRAAVAGEAPRVGKREEAASSRRVLLADDSLTTRALEKAILEGAGYEVLACADGTTAWKKLCTEPVDVVVTDVQMPGTDGFELTRKIRSDPRLRELPVVLVTSLESQSDRTRGLEVGADAYIVKRTFDQRELLDTLARLVGAVV